MGPGVDDGSNKHCKRVVHKRQASAKQLENLAEGRRRRAENIAAKRGGAKQSVCGFDDKSKRCNKRSVGNHNEWCAVGKSGRCKKSTHGKKSAPKNAKNVARGKALMKNLRESGKVAHEENQKKLLGNQLMPYMVLEETHALI